MRLVDDVALGIDRALHALELEIDWLGRLSPTDNARRWRSFVDSGYRRAPPLTYRPFDLDTDGVRARLDSLPVDGIEHPRLRVLLAEKQAELRTFATLLDQRDADGFVDASISLFDGTDPSLLADALAILGSLPEPADDSAAGTTDAAEAIAVAREMRERFAARAPDFDFGIVAVEDTDASMVVLHGELHVDAHLRIPRARVAPLVAHEVGVHVLTRYNGSRQPLELLASGLAHYDVLQEGLATFSEYLAGYFPVDRLRVLAARVVAVDLAVRGTRLESIFESLHREHELPARSAFEIAVRAKRGGGLTKDAVYLAGLKQLLAWLALGNDPVPLFIGKYAFAHLLPIAELLDEGVLAPPALLPECLVSDDGARRLAVARRTPVTRLYQREPPP